jgi:hypothetical protein
MVITVYIRTTEPHNKLFITWLVTLFERYFHTSCWDNTIPDASDIVALCAQMAQTSEMVLFQHKVWANLTYNASNHIIYKY